MAGNGRRILAKERFKVKKLLAALMLTGCGTLLEAPDLVTIVDPRLQPYVDDFFISCRFQGMSDTCRKNYKRLKKIEFRPAADMDPGIAGVCEITKQLGSHYGIIYIRQEYFDSDIGENSRKSLVWHELGHCVLSIGDHITDRPHIMNPSHYTPVSMLDWQEKTDDFFKTASSKETKSSFLHNDNGSCEVVNEQ